jgi:hypothetical protein
MIEPSEVWIWVREPIASSKLTIVDELIDATVLTTADAQQISRKANKKHAKFVWRPVPVRSPRGQFVVRGQPRDRGAVDGL